MKKSNVKKSLIGLIALASSGLAVQSQAEDGFYIGGSVSQSYVDERGLDTDDTGGKVFGGYKFNEYVAIEGGYYDFGEISNDANQLEIDGLSLSVVGTLPISSNVSLLGKIGVHDWDADSIGSIGSQLSSDSDSDALYGIGVNYSINDQWSIRGEVERYEVEDIDIDLISVGVSYNF